MFQPAEAGTSPEIDLLLACARSPVLGPPDPTRAPARRGIDWRSFLVIAHLHGVENIAHEHLSRNALVPDHVRNKLQEAARENARRCLFLTSRLLDLLKALTRDGVLAVPFKGPVLAMRAHANLAFRQSGDLDVFVRPRDLARARTAAAGCGYRSTLPNEPAELHAYLHSENQLELVGPGGVRVELHWAVNPRRDPIDLDLEALLGRAGRFSIAGQPLTCLSPEDSLILHSVHGTKHQWRRIAWVSDIAALIDSMPDIDWQHVKREAARARVTRMVRLGLVLAAGVLGATLPAAIAEWAWDDPVAVSLATRIHDDYRVDRGGLPGPFSRARFLVAAREGWRDKARYVWRAGPTPCRITISRLIEGWRGGRASGSLRDRDGL